MKTKISLISLAVFIIGAGVIMLANRGTVQMGTVSSASQPALGSNGSTPVDSSATAPVPVSVPVSKSNASKPSSGVPSKPSNQSSNTVVASNAPKSYTLADVANHNNASSCWSAINGQVYDLTSWINQHPGGPQAILSICGIDGSSAFNDQHGGQRRPANELSGFSIGTLVQ